MMALGDDDKREIKEVFHSVLTEHFEEHGISPASHVRDHDFIATWKKNVQTVGKAGLWAATISVISGTLALIWTVLKEGIK